MKRNLICLFTTLILASTARGQETLRVFLAPEGVTGNSGLFGISPTLANPKVDTSQGVQRLYLWAQPDGNTPLVKWIGIGLNLTVTGTAQITDWNINNYDNILRRWEIVGQGTLDGPAQQVTAINMATLPVELRFGVANNQGPFGDDGQYDPVTGSTVLGWFEFTGAGDVFLEVSQMGIVRSEAAYPPAEGVFFGFGDEADGLVGDDFNLASSLPDATLFKGQNCPWDLNSNGTVDTSDLLALFAQWGTDGPADFDGSGVVDTNDLLILFANWGPCP